MSLLPTNPESRSKLTGAINEYIDACLLAESAATASKRKKSDIEEFVKGELSMTPADFKYRVKLRRLQLDNPSKYEEEKEYADSVFEENEMLFQ